MGKGSLTIGYKDLNIDGERYVAVTRKIWEEIQRVLEHDFKVKMERRI
jgi:hypothetical protein